DRYYQINTSNTTINTQNSPLFIPPSPPPPPTNIRIRMRPPREPFSFRRFLTPNYIYNAQRRPQIDDYESYSNAVSIDKENILHWWRDYRHIYPDVAKMALDLLSIPAMSAE